MIKKLEKQFIQLCNEYAKEKSAIYTECVSGKKRCVFTIELLSLKLEFCYVKNTSAFESPSTLYCRIYLRKNSVVRYHIPDILPLIGAEDFRGCYFPLIENPTRMDSCFRQLCEILDSHLPAMENLAISGNIDNTDIFESYKKIYSLKEKDLDFNLIHEGEDSAYLFNYLQNNRDGYMVNLFTVFAPYEKLISGNTEKALELYEKWEKKRGLLPYEKHLCEFLKRDENQNFLPFTPECLLKRNIKSATNPPIWEYLLNAIVVYIPFAIVFCIIFAIIDWILSMNTLFSFTTPWYDGFLAAGLCGIFGSLALRNKVKTLLFGEKAKNDIEIDEIANSKGINIFMYVSFGLAIIFSLFASFMIISSHALFYEDTFKFTEEQGVFRYSEYTYDEIENVYYMESRYNDYGDRVDRASYVLVMKDSKVFDFDGFTNVKETEKTILPFLAKKGYTVKHIDSDKELTDK